MIAPWITELAITVGLVLSESKVEVKASMLLPVKLCRAPLERLTMYRPSPRLVLPMLNSNLLGAITLTDSAAIPSTVKSVASTLVSSTGSDSVNVNLDGYVDSKVPLTGRVLVTVKSGATAVAPRSSSV